MVQVQGLTLLRRGFQGRNCVRGGQPHGARRVSGYSAWYGLQHESNSFQVSPVITHFAVRHPCVRLLRLWFFLQGTCQPRHGYLQICKMRLFSVSVSAHPLAASLWQCDLCSPCAQGPVPRALFCPLHLLLWLHPLPAAWDPAHCPSSHSLAYFSFAIYSSTCSQKKKKKLEGTNWTWHMLIFLGDVPSVLFFFYVSLIHYFLMKAFLGFLSPGAESHSNNNIQIIVNNY